MISLPNPDLEDFSKVLKFSPVPEEFYKKERKMKFKMRFSELWDKIKADYFIIDIEDPETFNRRMIVDKTHSIGPIGPDDDDYEVVEIKVIPNNFCYGALGDKKLKNGIHIVLREL